MYRLNLFVSICIILSCLCGCSSERVIENPLVEAANNIHMDVGRIELSDSLTVLSLRTLPELDLDDVLSGEIYLHTDGKSYRNLSRAGEVLTFEPVPLNADRLDFIADNGRKRFVISGIELSSGRFGRKSSSIPSGLKSVPDDEASLPEFIYAVDTTTITVHVPFCREGLTDEFTLIISCLMTGQQYHDVTIDPETCTGQITFEQFATSTGLIKDRYGIIFGEFVVAPGESMHIWCDPQSVNDIMDARFSGTETPVQRCFFEGFYQDINNLMIPGKYDGYALGIYDRTFVDYRMSADEYVEYLHEKCREYELRIESSDLHPIMKGQLKARLVLDAVNSMYLYSYLRDDNYKKVHSIPVTSPSGLKPVILNPEQCAKVLDCLDLQNPSLWLVGESENLQKIKAICPTYVLPKRIANYCLGVISLIKAESGMCTVEDLESLKGLDHDFYYNLCERAAGISASAAEMVSSLIEKTPEVDDAILFDAILEKYKGKHVIVDFWNTWCGPCRAAISKTEPLKSSELKGDGLVWVYIANESSPMEKYREMITQIKGLHYRLTEKQWDAVSDKLKIDAIPSYVLVDKEGNYRLRNDLRNHDLFISELKNLLHE